jgi:hypothetical protein
MSLSPRQLLLSILFILGIAVAGSGWLAYSFEHAARLQDRADLLDRMKYLHEKAARGMFLEAEQKRQEALRGQAGP